MNDSSFLMYAVWAESSDRRLIDGLSAIHCEQSKSYSLVPDDPFHFDDVHLRLGPVVLFLVEQHWSPGDICGMLKTRNVIHPEESIMAVLIDRDNYYLPDHGLSEKFKARLSKFVAWHDQHRLRRI